MKFKDIDHILNLFDSNPEYKVLLNQIPIKVFFSLQNWSQLQKQLHRYLILWLHRPLLIHAKLNINTDKSFKAAFGYLHYLHSDTLPVGYVIELPKTIKLQVNSSFISATLGKVGNSPSDISDIPPVQHELMDKFLSVYTQSSTLVIAAKDNRIDFLT